MCEFMHNSSFLGKDCPMKNSKQLKLSRGCLKTGKNNLLQVTYNCFPCMNNFPEETLP